MIGDDFGPDARCYDIETADDLRAERDHLRWLRAEDDAEDRQTGRRPNEERAAEAKREAPALRILTDLVQGTEEWLAARRGIVTASVVGQLVTSKTIKPASNDYSRALTLNLVSERITGHTEPVFVNAAMERGNFDEPIARDKYAEHYGTPVEQVGFMTNDEWGFTIGYSPDGLVGDDGLIEIKSRAPKKQLATVLADEVPAENMAQIQAGLLVSGRDWCDYVSFAGGMPLYVKRVLPDERWAEAIVTAVASFEQTAAQMVATYAERTAGLAPTERIDYFTEIEF